MTSNLRLVLLFAELELGFLSLRLDYNCWVLFSIATIFLQFYFKLNSIFLFA